MRDNQCGNSGSNLRDRDFVHPSIPKSNKLISSILSEITSQGRCDLESHEVLTSILAWSAMMERGDLEWATSNFFIEPDRCYHSDIEVKQRGFIRRRDFNILRVQKWTWPVDISRWYLNMHPRSRGRAQWQDLHTIPIPPGMFARVTWAQCHRPPLLAVSEDSAWLPLDLLI